MIDSNQKIISHKVGLINLAEELQNVSQACKVMGFSRDTFYRYKDAVENGGVEALLEKTRRKPNLRNRVDPVVEEAVLKYAIDEPAHGQTRTSNELRKLGIFVSASGVRSIWFRPLSARKKSRKRTARSKLSIQDILAHRIPFMSARSKAWGASISRHLWILLARWLMQSCIPAKHPSPLLTFSMKKYCLTTKSMDCQCYAF